MKSLALSALCMFVAFVLLVACSATMKRSKSAHADHPNFKDLCSQCHTLDRVSRAHDAFTKEQMTDLVERMASKPGSHIDLNDIDFIVDQMY